MSNELKLTKKQICNQLGYSDSTIKRFRDDISMDSPSGRINYRKKNTFKTQTLSHKSNKKSKNTKNNKKNNNLKGSNPNDVHMSGRELIEQAFQNDKDPQEDNTNFFCQLEKL